MASALTDKLTRLVKEMRGQARITESNVQDMLREVRMALLEADVALPVVRDFIARVKEKALGQEVLGSLKPGQTLVSIVNRELAATIRQAQAEAGNTFQSYQARFAQLDKELGDALQGFGQHMTGAFDEFRKFAVQFDAALGQAVSKLGASLGAIEDYAGSLDDFVEKQARLFREPAE